LCCAVLALSACYTPSLVAGAPCDLARDNCPSGQSCIAMAGGSFCSTQSSEIDAGSGSGSSDASICFGAQLVGNMCFAQQLSPVMLATVTINTESTTAGNCTEIRPQTGGSSLCVVAGSSVEIASGAKVRAIGHNPLVLFATDTISVAGSL